MKVIKEGYVKPSNRLTCNNCGCVYEYDKEDIVEEKQEWSSFDSSLYMNQWHYVGNVKMVQCPTCSQVREIDRTILSSDMIPFN